MEPGEMRKGNNVTRLNFIKKFSACVFIAFPNLRSGVEFPNCYFLEGRNTEIYCG